MTPALLPVRNTISDAPSRARRAAAAAALGLALVLPAAGASAQPLDTQEAAPKMQAGFPSSFADLVEKVSPAVVSIQVEAEREVAGISPFNFPPGSPFERFFGAPPESEDGERPTRKAYSQGSGFLISADGYIVTNNHVIEDGTNISVVFSDGTEKQAELIGRDPRTDLAVIKIKGDKPFPYVKFDTKDHIRVGDWVVAVGNPFGLGGSVTVGIVSARGRDIGAGPYDDFIQLDAPINRGNSGGPTFDIEGNVIGVNTAIYSPSGGSVGIGFAIPSSIAAKVVDQLIDKGSVVRGWLGVLIQPVDKDLAQSLGLKEPKGAIVAEVTPESPAEKAGFEVGDVILEVNGSDMEDARDVSRAVANLQPDENAKIEIWRDGKETTKRVKIGQLPDEIAMSAGENGSEPDKSGAGAEFGMVLSAGEDGVAVENVTRAGEAAEKGIRPGDVILSVDGTKVKSPADFATQVEAAKKAEKRSILVLLRNSGGQRFVALALGSSDG